MECPNCLASDAGASRTKVLESRQEALPEVGPRMRRRRECQRCGARFTTHEQVVVDRGMVRGTDGLRPFSSVRLRRSLHILISVDLTPDDIERIVLSVQRRAETELKPIDTEILVGWVMAELPNPKLRARYLKAIRHLTPKAAERAARGQVTKRNGRVAWFNRTKLFRSIERAAHASFPIEKQYILVDNVEQWVIEAREPVSTAAIRQRVEGGLKKQDELAWVCYVAGQRSADFDALVSEITAPAGGYVRKKDGRLEAFDADRLQAGIELAMGKRYRTCKKQVMQLVEQIAREARASSDPMPTETIMYRVLNWLRDNDRLAFLGFLIAHVDFNVTQLADVLARWGFAIPEPATAPSHQSA